MTGNRRSPARRAGGADGADSSATTGAGRGPARSDPGRGHALAQRVTALLGEALAGDDAEAAGLRADDVLADPAGAPSVLGGPDAWPAARHAVVQRYGRVGALLVVGYEGRAADAGHANPPELDRLLDDFTEMDAEEIEDLLAALPGAELPVDHLGGDEAAAARRWLAATYAVAARDRTDAAHRAYMTALERVMRLAARRLAS